MKKPFLTPEAELILLELHDVIRTSDGNGLLVEEKDDQTGFGALIPLG